MSCTSCESGPKRCPQASTRGERNGEQIRPCTFTEFLALDRRAREFCEELIGKRGRQEVVVRFFGRCGFWRGHFGSRWERWHPRRPGFHGGDRNVADDNSRCRLCRSGCGPGDDVRKVGFFSPSRFPSPTSHRRVRRLPRPATDPRPAREIPRPFAPVEVANPGRQLRHVIAAGDETPALRFKPIRARGPLSRRENGTTILHRNTDHLRAKSKSQFVGEISADEVARRHLSRFRGRADARHRRVRAAIERFPGAFIEPIIPDDSVDGGRRTTEDARVARRGHGREIIVMRKGHERTVIGQQTKAALEVNCVR